MVGVHIRLAGNMTQWREQSTVMNYSRVEAQYETIKTVLDGNQNSRLFLATDNAWVEKEMMRKFGDQVLFVGNLPRMHTGKFTNEAGLMRAFTELYLLGKCDALFLSERSSFSRLANAIKKETAEVFFF